MSKRLKRNKALSYRDSEVKPLDAIRAAILLLALNVETARRTRNGKFKGAALSADLPELEEIWPVVELDATKPTQYLMQNQPPNHNQSQEDINYVEDFFH